MYRFKFILYGVLTLQTFSYISCKPKAKYQPADKTIDLGDIIAVGNIDLLNDTVYNGEIKFYRKGTKGLITKAGYINGIRNGTQYDYYQNNKLKASQSFYYGRQLGYSKYYDISGTLLNQTYVYFDIKCGSSMDYTKGDLTDYYFYSLDKVLLFHLNYDSIIGRKISDIQQKFFFIQKESFTDNTPANPFNRYFLYLLNPPKYSFNYSLVLTNVDYKDEKLVRKFNNTSQLDIFEISTEDFNKSTIKLIVYDSINNQECVMYKRLTSL